MVRDECRYAPDMGDRSTPLANVFFRMVIFGGMVGAATSLVLHITGSFTSAFPHILTVITHAGIAFAVGIPVTAAAAAPCYRAPQSSFDQGIKTANPCCRTRSSARTGSSRRTACGILTVRRAYPRGRLGVVSPGRCLGCRLFHPPPSEDQDELE